MKYLIVIILLLLSISGSTQSLIIDSVTIQHVRANKQDVLLSVFKPARNGDTAYSFILSANKDLKQKWKTRIAEERLNIIRDLQVAGDRIVATVQAGESEIGKGLFVYLFVLNNHGKVAKKILIGPTTGELSNLLIDQSKAYFTYTNSNSIYAYRRTSDTAIFATVDLVTGVITKKSYVGDPLQSPTLIKTGNAFLTVGYFSRNHRRLHGFFAMEVSGDTVRHRVIPTDHTYDYNKFFPYRNSVAKLTQYETKKANGWRVSNLEFFILDSSGKFISLNAGTYEDFGIEVMSTVAEDDKGLWFFVKGKDDNKNSIRHLSPEGKLLFQKEYALPVTYYNAQVWKAGNEFYATLNVGDFKTELRKLPIPVVKAPAPAVKKYLVTFKLKDEEGKPAAGAIVETFNVNSGVVVRRSVDSKGYLKVGLSESEFDRNGHTIIRFYYKDYPMNNRLLRKDWTPITYEFNLSKTVDKEDDSIKPVKVGN